MILVPLAAARAPGTRLLSFKIYSKLGLRRCFNFVNSRGEERETPVSASSILHGDERFECAVFERAWEQEAARPAPVSNIRVFHFFHDFFVESLVWEFLF